MENNIRDLQKVKCKKYIEMNEDEKKLAVNFIKLNNKQGTSIKDLDDMFCGKIYDKGKGVLFYFYKEVVLAKIAVVLECIKPLGNSFIHGIEVIPELRDSYEFLKDMIQEAKKLAIDCGAETVKLGVRNEEILRTLEIKGINKSYSAIKMKLNDRIIREKTLNLEELTKENSKRYQEVYNDSFSDMPHGTWLDNEGLNECLNNKNNDNLKLNEEMNKETSKSNSPNLQEEMSKEANRNTIPNLQEEMKGADNIKNDNSSLQDEMKSGSLNNDLRSQVNNSPNENLQSEMSGKEELSSGGKLNDEMNRNANSNINPVNESMKNRESSNVNNDGNNGASKRSFRQVDTKENFATRKSREIKQAYKLGQSATERFNIPKNYKNLKDKKNNRMKGDN